MYLISLVFSIHGGPQAAMFWQYAGYVYDFYEVELIILCDFWRRRWKT